MASERIEKLLAMQQKAEAQKRKPSSSSERRNIKSLSSETRKGRIVSVSAAGIWSIICPNPNC